MTLNYFKHWLSLSLLLAFAATTNAATVYSYAFGNFVADGDSTPSPWTGVPDTLASGLSNSSWATNYRTGYFTSYEGSCGSSSCVALCIGGNNYPSTTTYTLTFNINPGYELSVAGLSFWNRESGTGPKTANITIGGTAAVSNYTLAGTTGANTGTLTPVNSFTNLTGTFTLVITLSGATGEGGTLRLDNFVIDGTVSAISVINQYNVTGGGSFCMGGSGEVIGLSGSDTGVTYQLVNGVTNTGSPVAGTGSAISFGPQTAAGTYTVVATNTHTSATANMTGDAVITINALPVVSLGTPAAQCGGTVTLNAGNAGSTFAWSDNTSQQTDIVSVSNTYTVTVTNTSNCSASASALVTINTPPVITFTPSVSSICSNGSATIIADGANSYAWGNGATTASITVQPLVTTPYTVTGSDGGSCTAVATTTVTVSSVITTSVTTQICGGESYSGHSMTGSFIDTFSAVGGCDSIRTLNLTVLQTSNTNSTQTICAGQSYLGHTTNGNYSDTLTAVTGCDSVINLQLTVTPPITGPASSQTICYGASYNGHTVSGTFNDTLAAVSGCDSVISLTLTVLPEISSAYSRSICQYDTFMGHTTTGIYTDTLTAAGGCDSLIYLNLTVNPLPHVTLYLTFDTVCSNAAAITMSGGSPAGGYYSGTGIIDSQFVPSANTLGWDTIYYNYTDSVGCFKHRYEYAYTEQCTDSTDTTHTPTGIEPVATAGFDVWPNPAQDYITIGNTGNNTDAIIELYDMLGRAVIKQPFDSGNATKQTTLNLQQLPAGVYMLSILQGANKVYTGKIVKD